MIIDQGKVIANGTPDDLKSRAKSAGQIRLQVKGSSSEGFRGEVEKLSGVEKADVGELLENGMNLSITPKPDKSEGLPEALFDLATSKSLKILRLDVAEGQLDELFRSLTTSDVAA
ncbi:MAG: hypothetical protein AAF191_06035 [Verrucomicrobiota bacterium]